MTTIQKRLPQTFIVFISMAILLLGVWSLQRAAKPKMAETVAVLPIYGKIPDFKLTETSGREMRLADLKGQVWVANFIFTRCAGVCPMMSQKMRQIQNEFAGQGNIRFVSFSVDPEYDTPKILSQYAKRFEADSQKWFFLTGPKEKLFELSVQHFHLGVGDIPEAEREALNQAVRHSSKFALIDRVGQIRGYYDSESPNGLFQLTSDAKKLLGLNSWN